jgi:excisionase family DNA binding protein
MFVFLGLRAIVGHMRTVLWGADASTDDDLLTTGEAARLLGSSRQHVVDLADQGDLPFLTSGTHRRIRRGDLSELASRTVAMTRDQRRSLWLSHAVAGKLVADPEAVLAQAGQNLERMRAAHTRGQAARWLGEWERLLAGPLDEVLAALTSPTPRARELRQSSPFAAVLSEAERAGVLDAFNRHGRRRRPS